MAKPSCKQHLAKELELCLSFFVTQALESGKPRKGARILIHAASGGVGIALVQLAKVLYGAYVVGTTGPKNLDFVKVTNPL